MGGLWMKNMKKMERLGLDRYLKRRKGERKGQTIKKEDMLSKGADAFKNWEGDYHPIWITKIADIIRSRDTYFQTILWQECN